jgi:uncharacterized membrane protein
MSRWLYVSITATLLALGASLYVYAFRYNDLPAQVPIHWNIHGQADGFIAKENVLGTFLMMPAMMAGLVILNLVLPWISPRGFKVEEFRPTFDYIMAMAVIMCGYIHVAMLIGSLGHAVDLGRVVVGGILLFFALIGNVLGKVRRNFWMGVRTPWTLASETVWESTHRLAAWLFTAGGLLGLVLVFAGLPLWVPFILIMAAALIPVVYSLVLYKQLEKQGRL